MGSPKRRVRTAWLSCYEPASLRKVLKGVVMADEDHEVLPPILAEPTIDMDALPYIDTEVRRPPL